MRKRVEASNVLPSSGRAGLVTSTNGAVKKVANSRRRLPAVEHVLALLGPVELARPVVVRIVREQIAELRARLNNGCSSRRKQALNSNGLGTDQSLLTSAPTIAEVVAQVREKCREFRTMRIQPVINGTGVLLHTNLGRAPLGREVLERMSLIASGFNNLEYDLAGGARGHRGEYLESNLALLCGAEAATVVNNCAAALVLVLKHFTKTKTEVVISRGELIQIGGGFRIPEILEASGARLREVGTTNKTSLADYARALGPNTGLILKVHRSNFVMDGFVESPPTPPLAALARERRAPFVEDLGSGAIIRTETVPGLEHEPTPAELLKQGVDLVTFSGDKLFGGPQAGIIAGRKKLVAALKHEPFFRALRCDKLILSALEATVDIYLEGRQDSLPLVAMMRASDAELRRRAESLVASLNDLPVRAEVGEGKAQVGGGSLPRSLIRSVIVSIRPQTCSAAVLAQRLRALTPPVIGYIGGGTFNIDLRTVFPEQDDTLARQVRAAIEGLVNNGQESGPEDARTGASALL